MCLATTVAANLHALRLAKGLGQQDLADRAHISVSYVSMFGARNALSSSRDS
jgi:transcriptional regulator with XRE-family HTH domain